MRVHIVLAATSAVLEPESNACNSSRITKFAAEYKGPAVSARRPPSSIGFQQFDQ